MENAVTIVAGSIAIISFLWHFGAAIYHAVRQSNARFERIEKELGLRPWRNRRT